MVWRVSQMDEKGNDQLNRIGSNIYLHSGLR